MEAGNVWEAWAHILWWYRQARGIQSPTTIEAIYKVTVERAKLYRYRRLEGLRVPLMMH